MKYITVFRVVLGPAARGRMLATVSSSAGHHATPSSTDKNDEKYREIFHPEDKSPRAKK